MVRCLHERFFFFSFTFIPFIVLVIHVSILTRFIHHLNPRVSHILSLSFVFTFMITPLFLHALRESAQAIPVSFSRSSTAGCNGMFCACRARSDVIKIAMVSTPTVELHERPTDGTYISSCLCSIRSVHFILSFSFHEIIRAQYIMSEYETSAAIIETETSTAELAEEVHNRATQARVAAKEAALIAEAQPHLPSGAAQAGDTTTAARAEAQQASPEAAQQVHATAEHTKGVAEHAASTAHTKGPGVTGNVYDAVTQLRTKVEETTDAAVTEGQKTVQAATNTGANYLGQAKNLASSAISTAASYLPTSLTGGTTGSAAESASAQGGPEGDKSPGKVPASSTALESGSHTVSNPYPTTDVHAQQVAVNESK